MDRNQIQRIVKDWETQASQKIPVYIEFSMVNDIISSLEEITGKDRIDDPSKNKNDTLFRHFSLLLNGISHQQMTIHSFKRYYEKCLELELEINDRMHKGDTLHWIGRYYYDQKKFDEAFYYMILTFLDDVLSEFYKTASSDGAICIPDSLRSPVCEMLQARALKPKKQLMETI